MIFGRFSRFAKSRDLYAPIVDEISFLQFVCTRIKRAYPDFLVMPDPGLSFALVVQARQEGAPQLVADLCDAYANYGRARESGDRQAVIERFLSSIGNTVFAMDAPIAPEDFIIQLRHETEVRPERGEICLPFLGDLVAVLMRAGDGAMQPVTQDNLDVLGINQEAGHALAIANSTRLVGGVDREFDADWPGLAFVTAPNFSPSAYIYQDFTCKGNMPDGAYFVCDHARYIYTSARDDVAIATLVIYQRGLRQNTDRPVSESLLIRQKGAWHVASLAHLAQAA